MSRGARDARARARDDADAASPPSVSLQPESVLTFEGQKCAGQAAILAKLTSLPFQARGGSGGRGGGARVRARCCAETPRQPLPPFPPQSCKHAVSSIDAQLSPSGGILFSRRGSSSLKGKPTPSNSRSAFTSPPSGGRSPCPTTCSASTWRDEGGEGGWGWVARGRRGQHRRWGMGTGRGAGCRAPGRAREAVERARRARARVRAHTPSPRPPPPPPRPRDAGLPPGAPGGRRAAARARRGALARPAARRPRPRAPAHRPRVADSPPPHHPPAPPRAPPTTRPRWRTASRRPGCAPCS